MRLRYHIELGQEHQRQADEELGVDREFRRR